MQRRDSDTVRASFAVCWKALPRVSRSFALPIRLLPGPIGESVMVAYLIFRIADTVEDTCPGAERRRLLFADLRNLLTGSPADAARLAKLEASPYKDLMSDTPHVVRAFRSLPAPVREPILSSLDEMMSGMDRWSVSEVRTMADLHDYCYYVAGVVGKLLTRLFRVYGHVGPENAEKLEQRAPAFGRALQMVNVIRDLHEDHREGRHFWPTSLLNQSGVAWDTLFKESNRGRTFTALVQLVQDTLRHCDAAFEYLTLLPRHQLRLRMFCAIPLYMAISTLRRCLVDPALLTGERVVKIGRAHTRRILLFALGFSPSNSLLGIWYRRLRRQATPDLSSLETAR